MGYGRWKALHAILTGAATPAAPVPVRTSTDTEAGDVRKLARRMLKGEFGNEDERKRHLFEAGYDARAVQRRVNALLCRRR